MSYCITIFNSIESSSENDSCFTTATKNLTINKGSSYRITYNLTKDGLPADLTGYSVRGSIKQSYTSNTTLLNMTTSNLLLSIDTSTGAITMMLKESFTRRVVSNIGVYDIELLNPLNEVSRIVQGVITFVPEVTT